MPVGTNRAPFLKAPVDNLHPPTSINWRPTCNTRLRTGACISRKAVSSATIRLPSSIHPSDNFFVSSTVHSPKTAAGQRRLRLSQILTAANQLTLVRMAFLPFVVIKLVEGHYRGALVLFLFAGLSDGLDGLLARTFTSRPCWDNIWIP